MARRIPTLVLALATSVLTCTANLAAYRPANEDIALRKVEPRLRLSNGYASAVRAVRFSPDGKLLAAGGDSLSLNIWEAAAGKSILSPKDVENHDDFLEVHNMLEFTPDGKTLIVGGEDEIRYWDVGKQKMTGTIKACGYRMALSPDGKTLAAPSGWPALNRKGVRLYDVATRKLRATLDVPKDATCAAFSPDGKFLAIGDEAGLVHVRPTKGRADSPSIRMIHQDDRYLKQVNSVVFRRDGKVLASLGNDNHIKLWDAASGKQLHRMRGQFCAFTADGKYLFVSGLGGLEVWEVASGKLREEVYVPGFGVRAMVVSPDGKTLAIGHDNGAVRLFDVKTLLAGPK